MSDFTFIAYYSLQMPQKKYLRKTNRSAWSEEDMQRAVKAVEQQTHSIRKAGKLSGVPYATLCDRLKNRYPSKKLKLGRKPVLNDDQEAELANHILKLSNMFYGLTPSTIKQIAFEYAVAKKLRHNFNVEKKSCGKDWLRGFLARHPRISLRRPEATSLNRVMAFNRKNVNLFYDNLELVFEKYKFPARRIYNVDETGISGVHKPNRILAEKGRKQVGAITSGERGQTTTVVCCMSAAGDFVPPMFIFKRKRMNQALEKNGPVDAFYRCSKSGWITEALFLEWLQHFARYVNASKEEPVLVVLDNHTTHSSLNSYKFCRENGIVLVSLPPHTSHRLQPLDVTFFSSLKTTYNKECDLYMKSHHYNKIEVTDIAELFAKAYNRITSIEKGLNGFKNTGIFPLDRNVFGEEEFTEIPEEPNHVVQAEASDPGKSPEEAIYLDPKPGTSRDPDSSYVPSKSNDVVELRHVTPPLKVCSKEPRAQSKRSRRQRRLSSSDSSSSAITEVFDDNATDDDDKTVELKNTSFEDFYPTPRLTENPRPKRRKQKSQILTSTPLQASLEEKEEKREKKKVDEATKTLFQKKKSVGLKRTAAKKQIKDKFKPKQQHEGEPMEENDRCPICVETGTADELWWRCRSCGTWLHAACSAVSQPEDLNSCEACE